MKNIFLLFAEALSYPFIQRAMLAGVLIAACCAALGVFLVLRRMTMLGDGLAHVSFASVAVSLLMGLSPLYLSLPLVAASSLAIFFYSRRSGGHGDAAIGLISSLSMALGVLIASLAGGFNVDLLSYLFGSILLIGPADVILSAALALVLLAAVSLLFRPLLAIAYDEEYARVRGIKTDRYEALIAVLTSVTVVLGMRIVGSLLISALIAFPAMAALKWARSFGQALLLAAAFAIFSVLAGVLCSYAFNLPTGAAIVAANALLLGLSTLLRRVFYGR